jgi:hypothetical protein
MIKDVSMVKHSYNLTVNTNTNWRSNCACSPNIVHNYMAIFPLDITPHPNLRPFSPLFKYIVHPDDSGCSLQRHRTYIKDKLNSESQFYTLLPPYLGPK